MQKTTSEIRPASDGPGARPCIGPYRLERLLGRGGTSRVLLAIRSDQEFQQRVAIKIAERAGSPEALRRLQLERQILADLEHPNIARLFDGGRMESGQPYLVMEYVEGQPIDTYCDALPVRERLLLLHKVLRTVSHAHRHLVIHLDLKPANILVQAEGQPKLLDFGISKLLGTKDGLTQTPEQRPFTPAYASPEQLQGEPLTTASDLYSLGLLLYRSLTGVLPHFQRNQGRGEIIPPSRVVAGSLRRRLTGDLDAIVLKALQRRPEDRYATAEQFAADLMNHLEGRPIRARPATWWYQGGRFLRRHWQAAGLCACLLATTMTAAGVVAVQTHHLAAERDRSELAQREAEDVAAFLTDLLYHSPEAPPLTTPPTVLDVLHRGRRALHQLSPKSAVRPRLLHHLGATYRNWGHFEMARPLLEEALAIRRQTLDADHPLLAETLNSLGRLARAQADFEGSLTLHREALQVLRSRVGEDHLVAADSYLGLGNTLYDLLEVRAALWMNRRGCDIRRRHLGGTHRLISSCLIGLAKVSSELGHHQEGIQFAHEAIAIAERLWPEGHPQLANALNILAQGLTESRRFAEAEPVMHRVVELRRRFLHRNHPLQIEALNNLALVMGLQGRAGEAEVIFRDCLERVLLVQGTDHYDTVKATNNLGKALLYQGRLEEAEPLFRQSLDIARRLQPDGGGLAYPLSGLAEFLLADERPQEALPYAEEALHLAQRALGPDHRLTKRAQAMVEGARQKPLPAADRKESPP